MVFLSFCFRNFLANLRLTGGQNKHLTRTSLETSWRASASLLSNVRTEILNRTALSAVAVGGKTSPLLSFIHLEAQTLSRQISTVSAFMDDLDQVLDGRTAPTPRACDALTAIATHGMPASETSFSRSHRDLTGWIRSAEQRLTKMSADEDNCVFDLSVFGRPESFLDAALRHLARQQFKGLHSVCLAAAVVSSISVLHINLCK